MEQTTVNGRTYSVKHVVDCGPNSAAHSIANGWEPRFYMLEGKRGATYIANRSAKTGEFSITCRA